ncbi:MAG: TetR/AcrR family transcriptional regulator [Bacteroidales bacterium]|jgi:AcrR family transcriptional regulator|nr:TetR/AcrR family transcriptional regulator [Bacteroidales bacterium]
MNPELLNILEKVAALYMKYGIKSITMDDVARELGMSKKTLYQYVENKNDLVEKVVDYVINLKECDFKRIDDINMNAVEKLIEVNMHIVTSMKDYNPATEYDLKKYYPELYAKMHSIRRQRMYDSILANIKKGKEEGLYREELNEEIIARMQVSRFMNMHEDELLTKNDMQRSAFIHELFIYHIRGIANEKGLNVLEETLKKINFTNYL